MDSVFCTENKGCESDGLKPVIDEYRAMKDENGISSDMLDHSLAIISEGLNTGNCCMRSLLYCVIRDAIRKPNAQVDRAGQATADKQDQESSRLRSNVLLGGSTINPDTTKQENQP